MMDGSGAGFVSSGSCDVDIRESSGCNYKVQVYYQGIRNLPLPQNLWVETGI
jgi:hypothetical protein